MMFLSRFSGLFRSKIRSEFRFLNIVIIIRSGLLFCLGEYLPV